MTGGMAWCPDRGQLILVEDFGEQAFLHVFELEAEKVEPKPPGYEIIVVRDRTTLRFLDRLEAIHYLSGRSF